MPGCGLAGDAPMAGAWARRYSDCMSTHGRPKCEFPLGGKARSAKGAA
jgi:hypothetical protein